jgi:hypothetical protein
VPPIDSSQTGTPHVFTLLTADVVKVLKSSPYAQAKTIQIVQSSGQLDLGDRIVRVDGGYAPFMPGEEYIVFLDWNSYRSAFDVSFGPAGTFQIVGNAIASPAKVGPAVDLKGTQLPAFLARLATLR